MLAATQQWHARSVRRPTCPPPESMHCRGSLAHARSLARALGGGQQPQRARVRMQPTMSMLTCTGVPGNCHTSSVL